MTTAQPATSSATSITGMDLIGCTVADVPRSLAFYKDTLGLRPSMEHEQGAEFELADGTTLGVWQPGGATPGFSVMFAVADARAAVDLFRSRGAQFEGVFDSPVCVMAIGKDPDGNTFIIHQRTQKNDPPAPEHVRTAASINGIDIAAFFVTDPQRSIAFYRDVLGLTPTDVDDEGRGAEFTLADGSTFGVWRPESGATGGALMLAVDDARAAVDELRARGAGISDVDDIGNCYMAFAQDPDGTAVIVHQRK